MNKKQEGFGLIEVLVTAAIVGVGLLGVAMMIQVSLKKAKESNHYISATNLAYEMAKRISNHPAESNKQDNVYIKSSSSLAEDNLSFVTNSGDDAAHTGVLNSLLGASKTCYDPPASGSSCTSEAMATTDLYDWKTMIKERLPEGRGKVCYDSANNTNSFSCDNSLVLLPPVEGKMIPFSIKIQWTDLAGNPQVYTSKILVEKKAS